MTPDSSDEENTSEDIPVYGIEDAEVAVVWPDCVALMAPGHSGGEAVTPGIPGLTRHGCRVSEVYKFLLDLGLNLRRPPEVDSEQFTDF